MFSIVLHFHLKNFYCLRNLANIYENNKLLIKDLLFHGAEYGQHVYKIKIYDKFFDICVFSGYSDSYYGAQSYCITKSEIKPKQYPIDRTIIREKVNLRIEKYNKSLKQDK